MSSSSSEHSAMDEDKTKDSPPPPSPSGHSAREEEKTREEEANDSDASTEVASSKGSTKAAETAVSEPRASPERSPSQRSRRSQRSRSQRSRRSRRPRRSRRSRSRRSRGRAGGPGISNRHTINCWHGRACTRFSCWFNHPDGREIDEKPSSAGKGGKSGKGGKGKGKGGKNLPCNFRRRSKTPCRRRSPQSSSKSRTRSPRRRRSLSRSPSQKQPAPRRLTPAPSAPSAPSAAEAPAETKARAHSKDAELKAKASTAEPSFRDFVLKHVSNEDSPDFVMNRFQQYIHERLKEELQAIKQTGLFFDLYHPLSRLRRYELRLGTTQLNATTFAQDLREGRYCELSLRTSQARHGATCPIAGHLQAPEFAFDPDVGSLVIRSLPPAVSAWDVLDVIQDRPGFCTAAWTSFEGKDLARDFFARFTSTADATAAAVVLMRSAETLLSRPGSEGTGRASVLSPKPDLAALVLPQEMSLPERLIKDLALSEQVIQRLDGLTEVSKDITALVLNAYGSTEFKLDLRVTYLRRVHHFCFYAARWCDDEWSLRDACGIATLRVPAQPECTPGEWSAAHEQRLEGFLGSVSFDKPAAAPDYSNEHVVQRLAEEREKAILKVTDEKFKCKLCGKHFRGADFVRKHMGRMHLPLAEAVREELLQERAGEAWMADSGRPLGFIPSTVLGKDVELKAD